MRRALVVLAACGPPSSPSAPMNQSHATEAVVVTNTSASEWTVAVTHSLGARVATAKIVSAVPPTREEPAPHHALASAEAWLALARDSSESGAFTDAITAARGGIADLGPDYKVRKIKDDTELYIGDAEDQIRKGSRDIAAKELITALDTRVALYFQRYAASVRHSRVIK
jgi:hypothetical protein